ncbi:hypothetical protein [Planktothricoides raciborskii]|uniref:Uncharacterized protein n=1 Tax=Planktothricoides raciborskii GIHE-MW2 TaxID=2792601 RepID=A0AAU8JF83_9CYAN|nr:hypothetical protein [Planktothricoides raciborskii]
MLWQTKTDINLESVNHGLQPKSFCGGFPDHNLLSCYLFPRRAMCHIGHGDEFQATGGIERVQVNPKTAQMLGIVVTPINATTA